MSLRLPYVIYVALAGILVGALIAPLFTAGAPGQGAGVPMPGSPAHEMMHGTEVVPAIGAPQIALDVARDPADGWNLTLRTANFTFTPAASGAAHEPGTGHAHLYVNGMKVARLYGPHFHIPDLPPGDHRITVNLSTNAHDYYVVDGDRIEASQTVTQPAPGT